jgi:hypothetical protein
VPGILGEASQIQSVMPFLEQIAVKAPGVEMEVEEVKAAVVVVGVVRAVEGTVVAGASKVNGDYPSVTSIGQTPHPFI